MAVQSRTSLAGIFLRAGTRLCGKVSFCGSNLPPKMAIACGMSQGNFVSSLSSCLLWFDRGRPFQRKVYGMSITRTAQTWLSRSQRSHRCAGNPGEGEHSNLRQFAFSNAEEDDLRIGMFGDSLASASWGFRVASLPPDLVAVRERVGYGKQVADF
jgi:hypothetical protein